MIIFWEINKLCNALIGFISNSITSYALIHLVAAAYELWGLQSGRTLGTWDLMVTGMPPQPCILPLSGSFPRILVNLAGTKTRVRETRPYHSSVLTTQELGGTGAPEELWLLDSSWALKLQSVSTLPEWRSSGFLW